MDDVQMKGITCCADCTYYNLKKHYCIRGCKDEGKATDHFYADCPLPDVIIKDTNIHDNGWVSVNDRLPGKYEPFYAACKSLTDDRENWVIEGIYEGMTYGVPWGVPMIEMGKAEVYAWMPKELPEPPESGEVG